MKKIIHELATDMFDVGVIDKKTLRHFDESCLVPIPSYTAQQISSLREREQVSQSIFALHLNVSKDSISQWECGTKKPSGPSMKLLSLVERKGLSAII